MTERTVLTAREIELEEIIGRGSFNFHDQARVAFYPDLWIAVETWPYSVNDGSDSDRVYSVEFIVYEANRWTGPNGTSGFHFHTQNSMSRPNPTDDFDQAAWRLAGGVKWDGCSNYAHNDDDYGHDCGPHSQDHRRNIWRAIYKEARYWMPGREDLDDVDPGEPAQVIKHGGEFVP